MKKEPNKQPKELKVTVTQPYPKEHTAEHPNAYKVPIADLLNPDCPISAGVSEKLRAELLEKQAAGEQYHYIEDFTISYTDTGEIRKALNTRLIENDLLDRYEQEKPDIINIDAALDPDNPLSVLSLSEEARKVIRAKKLVGDAIAPYLEPDAATFFVSNIETIFPLVNNILLKMGLDPNNITIAEIAEKGVITEALKAAGFKPIRETEAQRLPQTIQGIAGKLDYPIDVVNNSLWSGLSLSAKTGQFRFEILPEYDSYDMKYSNAGTATAPALILYGVDFSAVENAIDKDLDIFDKYVYNAIGGLWHHFVDVLNIPPDKVYISLQQIYAMMGGTSVPNAGDKAKILASVSKMRVAQLYLNNYYERQVHKNRISVDKKVNLLYCDILTAKVNGNIVDNAIRVVGEPPLLTFARERNQITTIKRSLLAAPVNKNEHSMLIEDFFITRISLMKNDHNKMDNAAILYDTIFKYAKIGKATTQKNRAKATIKKLLDHYKAEGFITGYEEKQLKNGQGIELHFDKTRIAPPKK